MRLDAEYLEQQAERCLERADVCDKHAMGRLASLMGRSADWFAEAAEWRGEAERWRGAAVAWRCSEAALHGQADALRNGAARVAEASGLREQVLDARQVIRETLLPDAARQAVLAERRCRAHAILECAEVTR